MVQKRVISIIILVLITLIYSGCGKSDSSGKYELPEKVNIPEKGFLGYISPRALIDSLNHGIDLDIFYLDELAPENPAHIVSIPGMIKTNFGELTQLVRKLPKDRNIYIVCLYGDDSRHMADVLSNDGHNCYSLDGGSYRLWQQMERNGWRFLPRNNRTVKK